MYFRIMTANDMFLINTHPKNKKQVDSDLNHYGIILRIKDISHLFADKAKLKSLYICSELGLFYDAHRSPLYLRTLLANIRKNITFCHHECKLKYRK